MTKKQYIEELKCVTSKFLPLKNANLFVFSSFNRNFALSLRLRLEGTFARQSKLKRLFILYCSHLFVSLQQK